jgi:hypothetical protein
LTGRYRWETRSGRFCAGSRKCKVFRVITAQRQ